MIRVAITTYNRPDMLRSLIEKLYAEDDSIGIYVYDDGSDYIPELPSGIVFTFPHGGKHGFYRIISAMLEGAMTSNDWKYFIMLPDDAEPVDGFLKRSVELWEAIEDDKKAALGLLVDEQRRGKPCWTGFEPIVVETEIGPVYRSQWTEHALICDRLLLDLVPPMREKSALTWARNPDRSSGSGAHISYALHRAGYHIYQVYETLVHHGDHPSLMNPETRTKEPLTTK